MLIFEEKNTEIIHKIAEIKSKIALWKKQNLTIGFVPTMGALHKGHESLILKAKESCDRVVVSVFVNPAQFGPNEDYDKYPRELESDRAICAKNNVDIIFAPSKEEMYPQNDFYTRISPPESLQNKLCGKTRKGHFDGVAVVVLKLFNIVQPDKAFFGQKDAQQLIILTKMCKDLNLNLEIVPCPIVRTEDGLALSSRNSYLSESSRKKALQLSKSLAEIQKAIDNGERNASELINHAGKIFDGIELEYLEVVDFDTLEAVENIHGKTLVAIAAKVDGIRLIDNIIIEVQV